MNKPKFAKLDNHSLEDLFGGDIIPNELTDTIGLTEVFGGRHITDNVDDESLASVIAEAEAIYTGKAYCPSAG